MQVFYRVFEHLQANSGIIFAIHKTLKLKVLQLTQGIKSMSTSLKGSTTISHTFTLTDVTNPTVSTPNDPGNFALNNVFSNGIGQNQVDTKFWQAGVIAAGQSISFDLDNGTLSNGLNGGLSEFARVKTVMIKNTSNDISAEIEMILWTGDEYSSQTAYNVVQYMGAVSITAPILGYEVIPSTHDHLTLTNLSSTAVAQYLIVLTGTSE